MLAPRQIVFMDTLVCSHDAILRSTVATVLCQFYQVGPILIMIEIAASSSHVLKRAQACSNLSMLPSCCQIICAH
jgi:hypothetical protein